MLHITTIILTHNEGLHINRCLDSVKEISREILVVDSFSSDSTLDIARMHGVRVVQNKWVNYATQFNWALSQLDQKTDWILRIDADEYLTPELSAEIGSCVLADTSEINGVYCNRRIRFQGRLIRYGGVFPIRVLRIFRYGYGQCENRWMDEHIKVDGATLELSGDIIDDNLNSLSWWIDKHNQYASREAVDLLNLELRFLPRDTVAQLFGGAQVGRKRWIKENLYSRLPGGFRAFAYFFYRYVVRLGFLDGQEGAAFHILQAFWYRYLVDAKLAEVKRYMKKHNATAIVAIERVLGIKV